MYSITRTYNLGRYGIPYESIQVTVENENWEELRKDLENRHREIHTVFMPHLKKRKDRLDAKAKLTMAEEAEREQLKEALNINPF